jgi:pSer/pThr/pTyr-binding forkhead associated (FHA) protein
MQNGRKQEIILIRVINTDYSMDTVWDGQRQLCISLPAKYRSAVREISVCRSGGQMLMELRADKTEKYQITPGASVSLGGQADLRAEISVLPELRVVRYSLAGMRSIQIGRSSRSDIVLNDDRASRAHAMLTYESGIYTLSDLNSTNGTFVNGTRIKKTYLHDGDTFRIADSYFLFEREQLYWSSRPIKNVHAADVFKPAPQMRMMPRKPTLGLLLRRLRP